MGIYNALRWLVNGKKFVEGLWPAVPTLDQGGTPLRFA
jgi:hypothetical protein